MTQSDDNDVQGIDIEHLGLDPDITLGGAIGPAEAGEILREVA